MSRIGAYPINIPENTKIQINGQNFKCIGQFGETELILPSRIKISQIDNSIVLSRNKNDKISKSLHGVTRKLVSNAIDGVNKMYEKKLDIIGIGYKVKLDGKNLELNLGYSHPIKYEAPKNIEFKIIKNSIIVSGIDKQLVGQTAANIRALRKPEPYKGKGIKYSNEIVKRKAGKAAKAAGGEK